jgi:hypothetical protein
MQTPDAYASRQGERMPARSAPWFETRPLGAPHHEELNPHPEEGQRPVSKDEATQLPLGPLPSWEGVAWTLVQAG